jgi:fibronectin-binding autotransporter adhesin
MKAHRLPRVCFLILAFELAVLLPWQKAQADSYQVTNTNDSGPGSLRQAITDANDHSGADTITFAAATNGVPIVLAGAAGEDANASGDLDILDGGDLTIQGNGVANTIIDGGGIDRVFHVCPGGACTNTVTISGVTIRNGKPGLGAGGGVYNNGATLNIQNSKIGGAGNGNQAGVGGGIFNDEGSTTTVDSTTIGANAALGGGGIYNKATLTVQNGSTIGGAGESNQAIDGGGLYNDSGTLTVDGSAVSGNSASNQGGGIFNIAILNVQNGSTLGGNKASDNGGGIYNDDSGVVTVEGSTIVANTATNGYGGGIATNGMGKVTVDGSAVSANSAGISGGGIFNTQVLIVRNGSTVGGVSAANFAADKGGGIYNSANTTVSGSTVSANKAESGGGIYNTVTLNIWNGSTVGGAGAGNSATDGGGIYNTGTTRVADSTVNANEANNGGGIYNTGTLDLQSDSIIGEAGAGNQATEYGGGIYNESGTVTLSGCKVSANQAENGGGGIYSIGWLTIQNGSTIGESGASNHAELGGGVVNAGIMTLIDSSISANTADSQGGGVYSYGTLNITASAIGGVGGGNQVIGIAGNGGGIYNADRGVVTLDSSTVSANRATGLGGGIYNEETLNVQNGSFIGEAGLPNAASSGGGICNSAGTATVDGSTVSANEAFNIRGGGIYNQAILVVQNGSTIGGPGGGNTAIFDGGGIFNDVDGTATVDGSTVSANEADYTGGGITNNGTLNVQNGSLIGEAGLPNAAEKGGGIFNLRTTTVDGSTIGVNSATNGGGVYNHATLVVRNGSTIGGFEGGNEAMEYGGGIFNYSGSMTVTGSRILYNTATTDGGGVYNDVNAIGAAQVMSSCIVGNSAAAFYNNQLAKQVATSNWWGAATGPNTPGADTTSGNVDVSGFLTAPILDCALKVNLPLIIR